MELNFLSIVNFFQIVLLLSPLDNAIIKSCIGDSMSNIILLKRPHEISARPLLKWAGGKTQLLHLIIPKMPKRSMDDILNPFLGEVRFFLHCVRLVVLLPTVIQN